MAIEITALSESNPSVNMLVYGDSGAGKTVLGGTAPNALILAVESGTISAARRGSKASVVECQTYEQFAEVLNGLRKGVVVNPATGKPFTWIVVDTLTTLQNKLAEHITTKAHASNPARSPIIMDMLGWQEWANTYQRVVHAFNDLNENVLYLAHAMRSEDEELDPIVLPDVKGKLGTGDPTAMSRWTMGTVDLFGYLAVAKKRGPDGEPEKRRLIVERRDGYFGKDRFDLFGGHIDSPDMAEIHKRIVGSMKKSTTNNL